jgi:hypothetical protein
MDGLELVMLDNYYQELEDLKLLIEKKIFSNYNKDNTLLLRKYNKFMQNVT